MGMQKIIELSNDYYFIISEGKIYTSEGYASDIKLGEEFFDLTTINEKPKGKWEKFTVMDFARVEDVLKCNQCDWLNGDNFAYNYCPNCGAEMEGKTNDR